MTIMNVHQALTKELFTPLLEHRQGRESLKQYEVLKKIQWFSPKEIEKIQLKRLKHLLKVSYEYVPYYRKVFRERKLKPSDFHDLEDLKKLPILTKDILRNNFWKLTSTNCPRGTKLYSTSGTTGEPVNFLKTRKQVSWENGAGYLITSWYGLDPGYKHGLIWALRSPLAVWQRKLNILLRQRILNSFQMSNDSLHKFARELTTFKPEVLRGYSNTLHFFAQFVRKAGFEIRPKVVVSTGEALASHQRQEIQDVFGCDVFSFYASREISAIAAECHAHRGYHIMADNVILETIKDGFSVDCDETGVITLTNLCNYAMPLIRYKLGDLGSLSCEKCSCGIGLPLLKSLDGRISDILVDSNSRYSATPSAHYVFKNLPITQYQIVQNRKGEIQILIIPDEGFSENDVNTIRQRVQQYLGSFEVSFKYVKSISRHKAGKRRVIISQVPCLKLLDTL